MHIQKEITRIFSHLGKSEIEAATYLAALAIGSGSAAEIAQKTGEGRTKIYFHIKNLVKDGLLKESRKGQKQIFIPIPPSDLASLVSAWATNLQSLVPQLEALQITTAQTPTIEVSESRTGYFQVYNEISSMPKESTFRVLQGKTSMQQELTLLENETWQIFFTRIIERGIKTKALFTKESKEVPKSLLSQENMLLMQKRAWDLAMLPEATLNTQQLMFIYENKVAFLFPETALVMKITHQGIANTLAATFDALHTFGEKNTPSW